MRLVIAAVGTTGDVRPFATLAATLVERGHDVEVVSWEMHRSVFAANGVTFNAAGPQTTEQQIRETAALAARQRSPVAQVAVLRDFHLRDARAHYTALRRLLPEHDLALIHGVHSLAQAAATDTGVPFATAVFDPVLLPTATAPPAGMPSLGPFNRLGWRMLDRILSPLDRPLHGVLAEVGSKARPQLFRGRSPLLHLVACSPSIMRVPSDLPATTHVTGAWLRDDEPQPLPDALERFVADGPPPVVVTFGSMTSADSGALMDAVIAGARQVGQRAVVQDAPERTDVEIEADVARIGSVDHRALFHRASVVVHHGGAGTTHAAVGAGVPSIVVPHVGDQRYWGERLRALGVAPPSVPLKQADERQLADRLRQALEPEVAESARSLGARVRAERGVDASVRLLEETVDRR
jgi:sterol 3beta-glucosyltransferase/vancomycin aglycone glucosyltransferase